ncbi:MAG: hypothetical protein HUU11_16275 [Anaerolineales bacterium]|nr:hypothetical protein [Anaerolineales bacterium]
MILPLLLSFPLTYYYTHLLFLYYWYYDIGVNAYANSGWLTYFVMPWILVLFNITGFIAQWIARRRGMDKLKATGIGALAMAGLFIASFLYTVINHLDYPSPKDYNLFEFFGYLLRMK